jgi:hypothetical protein
MGMYLSADQPSRSLRTATVDDQTLLLAGGEGHVVGRGGSSQARIDRLVQWTQAHFPGAERTHQWSAQDYRSARRLPLVGALPGSHGSVLVATGFVKWGMTNATGAALAIAGPVIGQVPQWSEDLYGHTARLSDIVDTAKLNAAVAGGLARGWAESMNHPAPSTPPPEGQGVVGRHSGRPVAMSTVDGAICAVSGVCTHLGGVLTWNDAERTWDCPCAGPGSPRTGVASKDPRWTTYLRWTSGRTNRRDDAANPSNMTE